MHPILLRVGHLAIPTQGVLAALGMLLGFELATTVGKRLNLSPDRLWNLGLVTIVTYLCGERLLVIAVNFQDFAAHPLWMLGLSNIRDERYTCVAFLLAICAGAAYILAWRLPCRSVLDAAAPGAALAAACLDLGALAAGANPGRPTGVLGVVYASRTAARMYGTPLGIGLTPVMLYAAIVELGLAALCVRIALSARPGSAAVTWLGSAGLATVLLTQLRYPDPGEMLVLDAFTPVQCLGIAAVVAAAALWFSLIRRTVDPSLRSG